MNRRRFRSSEKGSQSLEWIALGSFVVTVLGAATVYANSNLGGELGKALVSSVTKALGH